MAREGLRSHLSGSVPISIAAHLVVLLLLLIIPLAADMALPDPLTGMPEFVRVVPLPPPPQSVPAPRAPTPSPAVNPNFAPIAAPDKIAPEVSRPGPQFDVPIGSDMGLPPGIGDPNGIVTSVPQPPPPPDPPRQTGPVRVALLPEPPRKIADARPIYPEIARMNRVEGTVVLEAVLDPTGRVTQLRVVRSIPLLDQAAVDAVKQWRYTPSTYGGKPVSVLMTVTIRFTLNQ
jgi:protein TonB